MPSRKRPPNSRWSSACPAATSAGSCCQTLRMPVAIVIVLDALQERAHLLERRAHAEPERPVAELLDLGHRVRARGLHLPDTDPSERRCGRHAGIVSRGGANLRPGCRCRRDATSGASLERTRIARLGLWRRGLDGRRRDRALAAGLSCLRVRLDLRDRLDHEGLHRDTARRHGAARACWRSGTACRPTCQPGVRRCHPRGREITLADLSSHRSGLPALPQGLLVPALTTRRSDPYADWDAAASRRRSRAPGHVASPRSASATRTTASGCSAMSSPGGRDELRRARPRAHRRSARA